MSEALNLLLLALLGSVIALFGGVVFLFSGKLSKWLSRNSTPFAAGVLLTVALMGILPESVDVIGESAFGIALSAFLAAFIFEQVVCGIHHHENGHDRCSSKASSIPLVIVGDTIHNFIDGLAIAAAFLTAPGLGLVTAISTFLHEVPHEIGDFGILLAAGWKKGKIVVVNVISALMTVVGAFFVFYFMGSESLIGVFLAIAAGIFLYLGASDFLPHIGEDGRRWKPVMALLIGVMSMALVLSAIPHSH